MQYNFVPWLRSRPKEANQSPPRRQMAWEGGRTQQVSCEPMERTRCNSCIPHRCHCDCLHIGDSRGTAKHSYICWEGRLQSWLSCLPLKAFYKSLCVWGGEGREEGKREEGGGGGGGKRIHNTLIARLQVIPPVSLITIVSHYITYLPLPLPPFPPPLPLTPLPHSQFLLHRCMHQLLCACRYQSRTQTHRHFVL